MSENNKVVIKINYQGAEKEKTAFSKPQIVNEWHIKRLLIALGILLFIVFLLVYFFSDNKSISEIADKPLDHEQKASNLPVSSISKANNTKTIVENNTADTIQLKQTKKIKIALAKSEHTIEQKNKPITGKKESHNIISDPRIIRALLTSGLNNKEPLDNISSFITVNKNNAQGVYYFTEIINMKGQRLSHQWLWNNKTIYEKTFNILGNRWRAATSKLIPYSKSGLWVVRLLNEKGDSLNEISFEVIKEE